jgi:hypothetical protein
MAIYRLIAKGSFGPEEIKVMTAAYEGALADLKLNDRNDPITELIASTIIAVSNGEHDPIKLKERALNAMGLGKPTLP